MRYQPLAAPPAEGSILNANVLHKCAVSARAPHIPTECRPFSDDLPRVGRYRTDECSINPDCSND